MHCMVLLAINLLHILQAPFLLERNFAAAVSPPIFARARRRRVPRPWSSWRTKTRVSPRPCRNVLCACPMLHLAPASARRMGRIRSLLAEMCLNAGRLIIIILILICLLILILYIIYYIVYSGACARKRVSLRGSQA